MAKKTKTRPHKHTRRAVMKHETDDHAASSSSSKASHAPSANAGSLQSTKAGHAPAACSCPSASEPHFHLPEGAIVVWDPPASPATPAAEPKP
jgi:hypothetical protein